MSILNSSAQPLEARKLSKAAAAEVGLHSTASQPSASLGLPTGFISLNLNLEHSFKAFGGDHAFYARLLHQFVAKQQGSGVPEARRRFESGDQVGAIELIHGLNGMAGLLQLSGLSETAAALESAMLDKETDKMPVLFDQLQAAMDTVIALLKQFDTAMSFDAGI
jgi:HPt (histidine-containing phosphotransfer) domain-containing protein